MQKEQRAHTNRQTETFLVSEEPSYLSKDVMLMGGLSILVCACYWLFIDKGMSLNTVAEFAFAMAFVINYPHFMSSYLMLYNDYKKKIFKDKKYFFSAVILPLLLAVSFGVILFYQNAAALGNMATVMFALVGWHYFKQSYGFVIVTSAQKKIYYSAIEKKTIWCSLFSVWALSIVLTNVGSSSFDFYGFKYSSLNLPIYSKTLAYGFLIFSLISVIAMQARKYLTEGVKPLPAAVTAYATMFVWHLPLFAHPAFYYIIPFFHSLQYLTFVWLLKKNQFTDEVNQMASQNTEPDLTKAQRKAWLAKTAFYLISTVCLGALFFELIPRSLDKMMLFNNQAMGKSPFVASFILFINIHHYFIDNAIWRSDNESVRKYLFQSSLSKDQQQMLTSEQHQSLSKAG